MSKDAAPRGEEGDEEEEGDTMRRLIALTAALSLGVLANMAAPPAQAVVPGENGRILFARCIRPFKCGSDTVSTWEIVAADADDSNETVLAGPYPRSVWDDHFVANWSPDGSSVIFMAQLGRRQAIWQVNSDATDLHKVFTAPRGSGLDDGPAFTPDGKHIIFTRCCPRSTGYALWSIRADGTHLEPVTDESVPPGVDGPSDNLPQVSPDGRLITFNRNVVTCADPTDCGNRIVTVDINGGNLTQLTDPALGNADSPNWSPDSKKIVFSFFPFDGPPDVATINPDGSGYTNLTFSTPGTGSFAAAYSPDGTKILFDHFPSTGRTDLFMMNADGSGVTQVTKTAAAEFWPQWGVANP
jgi:Tol biopolymer transport system component